jgi:amino-acid racemase
MKTIGLIGGMSWESSLEYYRLINETVKARLGGLHSARCLMYSVDFAEIETLQREGRWLESAERLSAVAQNLEAGGADFIILCTNTMHKVADVIQARTRLPLLHIADPTAEQIRAAGLRRIGLLGTRFTMEEEFYKQRLIQHSGLEVLIPPASERQLIHRVIYEELVLGDVRPTSKMHYLDVIKGLVQAGAEGIILSCTEIGLLIQTMDYEIPLLIPPGFMPLPRLTMP